MTAPVEVEDDAQAARRAQAKLEEARPRLAGRELPLDFVPIVGPPGEAIVRLADERGEDLIVVGTQKKGFFERLVEGSVNQEVLRRAPAPSRDCAPCPSDPATSALTRADSLHSAHCGGKIAGQPDVL